MQRLPDRFYGGAARSLRNEFLSFFRSQAHAVLPSATLTPGEGDTSLLFTVAGMVPFKQRFLSRSPEVHLPPNVATVQRCMRAGGKDCDLENVGKTNSHLTFFEMLGNFSFGNTPGSYYKERAIQLAYTFVTERVGLDKARLMVTYLEGDEETRKIWSHYFPPHQIVKRDKRDNWWAMGSAADAPCGPCTELYFQRADGSFLEIWNLVFMQQTIGGQELKYKSVDTGMGLERLCSVVEGVESPFDIQAFKPLVESAAALLQLAPTAPPVRILADHARAAVFLASDGVTCGPTGRGFVLRRLIRRAARHAYLCGVREPVLHQLMDQVLLSTEGAYPEVPARAKSIASVLVNEERAFLANLGPGIKYLQAQLRSLSHEPLPALCAFTLNSQFGFPYDLTAALCAEQHVAMCDPQALLELEAKHRDASKHDMFEVASIYLSICLMYLSVYLSYLSYLSIYRSISIYLSIYLSTSQCVYLSISPSTHPSIPSFAHPSVHLCLSLSMSIYLSKIYLHFSLSLYLFRCLSL